MSRWKTIFEPKYEPYATCIPTETHDLAYREFRRHESFLGKLVVGIITRIQNRIQTPIAENRVICLPFIGARLTYSIRCERPVRLVR
jgi:hypothetical protein